MMSPMPSNILREFNLTGEDTTPPLTAVPADLNVYAAREGGAMVCIARVGWVDEGGVEIDGGYATVQWYAVKFMDPKINTAAKAWPFPLAEQPPVRLSPLGGTTSVDADGVEIVMPDRVWLWPVIHAVSLPTAKIVRITIGGNSNGQYSIQRDSGGSNRVTAVGQTIEQIRNALVAAWTGDDLVDAAADPDAVGEIVMTGPVGLDYYLTLQSPGDTMAQAADPSSASPAVKGRIYFHADRPLIDRGNP